MLDNADYDSTNGSVSFDNHKLPGLRAKLCKIRLITWKKSQNIDLNKFLIFLPIFRLRALSIADITDFDIFDGFLPLDN